MKTKNAWLLLACFLVTVLLLASCGPATPTTAPPTTAPPTTMPPATKPPLESPKYGGVYTLAIAASPLGFDDAYTTTWSCYSIRLTNEELLIADWSTGPAGTNEYFPRDLFWHEVGNLAESWDVPDANTIVFHIRKGIRYALSSQSEASRLVGGRELVAADVAFSLNRHFQKPDSYLSVTCPGWFESASATDKYTVVVKCKDGEKTRTALAFEYITECAVIVPPEVVQKYGDLRDWKNSVGTGTFVLTDYVPDSALTVKRNPSYWGKDPINPKNQLPYLDEVRMLIIKDESTRLAALRAGQVDWVQGVAWDKAQSIMKTNPELQWARELAENPFLIFMRTDTKPFDDIRVRQALSMAINQQEIAKQLYGGNAEICAWPEPPLEKMYLYVGPPLEKRPESIKELFQYNPDKAKKLLADAGYPTGFKTSILCANFPVYVDTLSLVKDYWAKIGVDLTIDAKEWGVFSSQAVTKAYKEMVYFYACGMSLPHKFLEAKPGTVFNLSIVNDPYMNERLAQVWAWGNMQDEALRIKLVHEMSEHYLNQAYTMQLPTPYSYTFYPPWVKNYHGEYSVGSISQFNFPIWVWIDQDLKKSVGH